MKKLLAVAVGLALAAGIAVAQWTTNAPGIRTNLTGAAPTPAVLVSQGGNATNLTHYGPLAVTSNGLTKGTIASDSDITAGISVVIRTNALITWPAAPANRGAAAIVNSNGTVYMLISGPNGDAWTSTNKIAP